MWIDRWLAIVAQEIERLPPSTTTEGPGFTQQQPWIE